MVSGHLSKWISSKGQLVPEAEHQHSSIRTGLPQFGLYLRNFSGLSAYICLDIYMSNS
jgi:hypothetical protein